MPTQDELLAEAQNDGQRLIRCIVALTLAAQETRKELTLGRLDKMPELLLEVEKASRNARTTLAAIETYTSQKGVNN